MAYRHIGKLNCAIDYVFRGPFVLVTITSQLVVKFFVYDSLLNLIAHSEHYHGTISIRFHIDTIIEIKPGCVQIDTPSTNSHFILQRDCLVGKPPIKFNSLPGCSYQNGKLYCYPTNLLELLHSQTLNPKLADFVSILKRMQATYANFIPEDITTYIARLIWTLIELDPIPYCVETISCKCLNCAILEG